MVLSPQLRTEALALLRRESVDLLLTTHPVQSHDLRAGPAGARPPHAPGPRRARLRRSGHRLHPPLPALRSDALIVMEESTLERTTARSACRRSPAPLRVPHPRALRPRGGPAPRRGPGRRARPHSRPRWWPPSRTSPASTSGAPRCSSSAVRHGRSRPSPCSRPSSPTLRCARSPTWWSSPAAIGPSRPAFARGPPAACTCSASSRRRSSPR